MNLLVVDDEYYIVKGIVRAIDASAIGIDNVFTAYDAEEAKEIIGREHIDILLTDIEMPQESGLSLISWAKNSGYHVWTIILTGHQRFDYAQTALQLHCMDYVLKPVDPMLLEPKLARAVNFINTRGKSVDIICDEDTPPADTFTLRIQKYLSDHIDNPDLSRSMAADYLHINPDYLSSLFHRQFGQTFNTYITARRIDRAKELLINTDFSLSLISQKCGFSSSSYFNKTFKKEAGITPQQYRSGFGTRRKGVQDGTNSDNT